ncbi:retrovirus-related pol polyprotein from transposon TNT 1-94 [Tanacetum coccineum]|uniref:Retrovirus-related pol polyprotein from transposon TNT 1-94 n=1 Tax=Tanacetum coccineum TaxID=301880 RepID=A0ABQ5GP63_9ASTR
MKMGKKHGINDAIKVTLFDVIRNHDEKGLEENFLSKFNSYNQELSLYKIYDLKKVIEKWTSNKVTLDQLLTEQAPGNIVHALGGRGKKKEAISSKEVVFTKADESPSETAPKVTSDSESKYDNQESLPPLSKLSGAKPHGTSKDVISFIESSLTLTISKETKKVPDKKSAVKTPKKKAQTMSPSIPDLILVKEADSFTEQLLLTLMEEVKGLKERIKPPSDNSVSISQTGSSKSVKGKQKTWLVVVKKTLARLKAQSSHGSSSRKAPMIPKPFIDYNSLGDTEGYDLVKCNGITFTRVAFVNGLKPNQHQPVKAISVSLPKPLAASTCFWYKRLSHINFKNINKLSKQNLVVGLPSLTFSKDKNCSACEKGKHHRASFKTKRSFSISKCLHLLHMDLFGPVKPQTISHNKYTQVIVNEYSRSIIVKRHKKTAYEVFKKRSLDISYFHVFGCHVFIHNYRDHLGKFDEKADDGFFFLDTLWLKPLEFSTPEDKKMEETYHVTFSEDDEAISQSSTEGDEINFNENYSFFDDYFHYVLAFDPLSTTSLSLIPSHPLIKSSLHLMNHISETLIDVFERQAITTSEAELSPTIISSSAGVIQYTPVSQDRWSKEKHINLVNIIGKQLAGVTRRSRVRDSEATSAHECLYVNFLSKNEPKMLIEALEEEGWIIAMQEELNQFKRNKVLDTGPVPHGNTIIRTKLIFRNKIDKNGFMIKNKARLIDVKSAFLNGKIYEEVYVKQPPGFEKVNFPTMCHKFVRGTKLKNIQVSQRNSKSRPLSAKKQSSVAMSSAKVVYVVIAGCYAQVLWIKSQLADYDSLDYSGNYISIPTKETVDIGNIIFSDLIAKLLNGKKGRDPNVCYTRESSPLKQVVDTQLAKEPVATDDTTKSLDAFESAEELGNQPNPANAKKVQKQTNKKIMKESEIKSLGNVSFDEIYGHDLDIGDGFILADQDMKDVDSDLESMPEDAILSISGFEADDDADDRSETKVKLSKTDEAFVDNIIDELVDMANSQDVAQLESSLAQQVAAQIEYFLPRMVADAFEERIPKLLSDTLKNILPRIIKDSSNQFVDLQKKLPKAIKLKWENLFSVLVDLIKDLVILIDISLASSKAAPEGENMSTQANKDSKIIGEHESSDNVAQTSNAFVIQSSEEPPVKKLNSSSSEFSLITPPKGVDKGKGKAQDTDDDQLKQIMPLVDEGEMKRLVDLKAEKEKSKKSLNVLTDEELQAQAAELVACSYTGWETWHSSPPKLIAFEFPLAEKKSRMKRKRRAEVIHEVFVKDNVEVDGMHKNLVPPAGVVRSLGLVIEEPKAGIFVYTGSFDLTAQDMFNRMIYVIEAREDVVEAKEIVQEFMRDNPIKQKGGTKYCLDYDSLSTKLVKAINSWQNCSVKYGLDVSKNGRAFNAVVLLPQDS